MSAERLLFIDASISGIAGDMLVAALIDLGVPLALLRAALAGVDVGGYRLETPEVVRSGIVAKRFVVHVEGQNQERTWKQIRSLINGASTLTDGARSRAIAAFERLAEAEATVHGMAIEDVHFHEVGAVDSIVDIVAAAVALDHIGAEVVCSPLPLGHGTVRARHGVLPLPAPATVNCLRGVPTFDGGVQAELVTPTGAALVATSASRYVRWPNLRPEKTGWGAGSRELDDRPNLVRVVLGEAAMQSAPFVVLEANVDDMSAEIAAHVVDQLFAAGALDAWLTPITMKKGRLGMMISALGPPDAQHALTTTMLAESTSLGVRIRTTQRVARPRRMVEVSTAFGLIAIKIADGDGLPRNVAPELDACRTAAKEHGVPLKEVFAAAIAALDDA